MNMKACFWNCIKLQQNSIEWCEMCMDFVSCKTVFDWFSLWMLQKGRWLASLKETDDEQNNGASWESSVAIVAILVFDQLNYRRRIKTCTLNHSTTVTDNLSNY